MSRFFNWNPFIFVGYRNDMSFPHTNPYISTSPIMALDFEYYTTMPMFADAHISSLKYLCYNLFKLSLTPLYVWPLIVLKIFCNFSYRFLISFSLYKSLSSITKYFYWFFFVLISMFQLLLVSAWKFSCRRKCAFSLSLHSVRSLFIVLAPPLYAREVCQ